VLALGTMTGAPVAVEAQTMVGQPQMLTTSDNPMMTKTSATTTGSQAGMTIVGQPQPGPSDSFTKGTYQDYGMPMMMPPAMATMVPVPPGSVWIPAHYNWDPHAQNYVWLEGEFAQPPRPGAQWVAGHWQQTPTAWVWVDGNWN